MTSTSPLSSLTAVLAGAVAMTFVGSSVAASAVLADAPLFTAQSVRYAVACVLLLAVARRTGRGIARPRGTAWLWLVGVTGSGLVLFNVALVHGSRHAEPAVLGVAVASVPILLAAVGPLLEGRRPAARALAAAGVVSLGAAVVQGLGRSDGTGLALAVLVFACEAGFTLLAVPVLRTLGPYAVSVHTTWIAALGFGVLGVTTEGPTAALRLTTADLLAVGYLAVGVTAVAFVLWYTCVSQLGSARAGLLTGLAPIAAAVAGVVLGGPLPQPLVWVGMAVVGLGLVLGLGVRGSAHDATGAPSRTANGPGAGAARAHRAAAGVEVLAAPAPL